MMLTLNMSAWHDDEMERTEDEIVAHREAVESFVAMLQPISSEDITLVTQTVRSFHSLRFQEVEAIYRSLDERSQGFVTDVITALSQPSNYSFSKTPPEKAAKVTIACLTAPVFTGFLGERKPLQVTLSYVEEVGLYISHAYRVRISALNWEDAEVLDYTRGTALIVAAWRKEATSFENVIWLGKNSDKLIPFIDRIAEVSAEREYLQTVLDSEAPLTGGVL